MKWKKRATDLIDLLPQKDNLKMKRLLIGCTPKAIINETSYESPSITFDKS